MPAGGSKLPASHETVDKRLHYVKQEGATVFKFAVKNTEEIARRLLERNGLEPSQIDLFVSHQANRRIIEAASERLGLGPDKVIINLEMYGNTTAGTIPLALADARRQGRLKKGDLVLLCSVGAGFTVGAVLLRWSLSNRPSRGVEHQHEHHRRHQPRGGEERHADDGLRRQQDEQRRVRAGHPPARDADRRPAGAAPTAPRHGRCPRATAVAAR